MSAVAAKFDLTLPQVNLLRVLEFGPSRNMGSVAEALACDASNVTGIVDRLERRGLIARATGAEDRRVRTISLTARGRKVLVKLAAGFLAPPAELRGLSLVDLKKLHALIVRAFGRRRG